jgi:outer membrane biosynthesis protein TonB
MSKKPVLALILALCLTFALVACSVEHKPSNGGAETTGVGETPTQSTEKETEPSQPANQGTEPTQPADPSDKTQKPDPEPTPEPEPEEPILLTYEEYKALSSEEQLAYYYTFESGTAFNAWYNQAKAEWDAKQDKEITNGNITLD